MTHIYGCQLCSSFSSSFVLLRCSLDLGLFGPSLMIIGHALRSSEFRTVTGYYHVRLPHSSTR